MKHLGDITKINGAEIEPVDVITGGSPCQDLSVAGKRAGLAGERSGLYMDQIRIIKEMRDADHQRGRPDELCRPRYMVWENVPGAFSSQKGADFAAVLEEVIRVVEPQTPDVPVPEKGWPTSGCIYDDMGRWSVAWRVHDAQFWGVPQRRRRVALVADFGGLSAPEVLFERKGLSGNFEPGEPQGKEAAGGIGSGSVETSGPNCLTPWDCQSKRIYTTGGAMPTLPAMGDSGRNNQDVFCAKDAMPTVYDARGNGDGETVCTITGDHENRVTDYTALLTMQGFGDYRETGVESACKSRDYKDATDLVVSGIDARNGAENGDLCGTLQAKPNGGFSYNCIRPVRINKSVRRLTPLECERMQGYPDGWTDIGEWVDSKGKRHDSSDSARYKALGNSIALPFWRWLMRRISAQYVGTPTLGSLFDGIGGFPLCWEGINGKGSARWASEIEEFPIAVTKFHFGGEE